MKAYHHAYLYKLGGKEAVLYYIDDLSWQLFFILLIDLYKFFFLLTDGFAFSQEEHGVMRQSEVIRAYDTTRPKPGGM